jgi:type I restriction enzyme S subunit
MSRLPAGWRVAALGEIVDTKLGKMLDRGKIRGLPSVPYLRNVNVQWGRSRN